MSFKSVNPKNGKLIKSFENLSNRGLQDKMELSFKTYRFMKNQGPSGLHDRMAKFEKVKQLLTERKQVLAELVTTEMGKPVKESVGEVDKSIAMIDFFNKNTEKYLEEETISTKYKAALVVQQPWGPSLSKIYR
jgi:succinate-semialdehyde dehydrogenase/glutarate-semialdehyde dehydrogenase